MKHIVARNCIRLRGKMRKKNVHGKDVCWSRGEIAEKAGISVATYERIEWARNSTTLDMLEKLCHVFNVKARELVR